MKRYSIVVCRAEYKSKTFIVKGCDKSEAKIAALETATNTDFTGTADHAEYEVTSVIEVNRKRRS